MATDVKAVMKVEGEQSFAQAFKNATSSVKALDTAVKLNAAAFENTGDKMSNLKERSELLKQEIEAQKNVIKMSKEELQRLTQEYGEGSTEVNNYQAKVNQASTRLEQMERDLTSNENAMRELGTTTEEAGNKLEDLGSKLSGIGKKISGLGSDIKWLSAGAAAGLTAMFNAASDLNENLNKTEVVFGDLSEDVEAWSKTTLTSFGIAQSSALEMTSFFGDMATSMGLTKEQAAEMGKELVGRAGDMASFKNVSLDVAQNGLAAIFTGQAASLRKFGIVMTEANLEAFALANGFTKQYSEMDQAEKVMLRYQFVMDATKNSAGDFANTSDGAANSVRVAQESLKEAAATLGQEVIPLVLPLIQGVTDLVQGINSLDEGTRNLIVTGTAVVAVASPILTVGGKLIQGVGWLFGTGLPALGTAFTGAGTAATAAGAAGAAGISAMLGPIALVAGAVVGLIALFDSLETKKNRALNQERMNNINQNYTKIDASNRDYYRAEDLVGVWNGSGWDEYVKNGASMTTTGRREYYADQMEKDSVTNYNFDVNVQQVSDLQDLLNMADSAQRLDRMGWSN